MTFYNINNSSQSKIEGKFYALKNEEHLRACRELTSTQRDIFYYLKSLDPYGDRPLNISIVSIAKQLRLSRFTVSRALKALDSLGWLELELIYVRARVLMRTSDKCDNCVRQVVSGDSSATLCDSSATLCDSSATLCDSSATSAMPEPLSSKGFKPSKTIKTIKTIKTLSLPEKEREKFLEFAMRKAGELPKPPTLPKKWIDTNHDELWAKYQELEQRKETNEQRRKETIDKPQETVVDPRILAALQTGKILEISYHDKMFKDTDGWWQKWHEYDEWIAKRSADSQLTNEELLRNKQLIMEAANIPS